MASVIWAAHRYCGPLFGTRYGSARSWRCQRWVVKNFEERCVVVEQECVRGLSTRCHGGFGSLSGFRYPRRGRRGTARFFEWLTPQSAARSGMSRARRSPRVEPARLSSACDEPSRVLSLRANRTRMATSRRVARVRVSVDSGTIGTASRDSRPTDRTGVAHREPDFGYVPGRTRIGPWPHPRFNGWRLRPIPRASLGESHRTPGRCFEPRTASRPTAETIRSRRARSWRRKPGRES
jgi:hypothetical protein